MALTFFGVTEFRQSGSPQWQQSLWELDSLTIPYSGSIENLNDFLDDLEKGQASPIDDNMLLVDWRISDQNKQWPTVDLIYLGKKNGILPPGKNGTGNAVQTVTTSNVTTGPLTITYLAPVTSYSWISTEQGVGGLAVPPGGESESASYALTGTSFSWVHGLDILTGVASTFTTEVRVGDRIVIFDPEAPPPQFRMGTVAVVTDNTHLTMAETNTGATFFADFGSGFHISDSDITVIAIKTTATGFGGLLTGQELDQWGAILIAAYFEELVIPTVESEELVPARYWSNVQRMTSTLFPQFDD